MLDPKEEIKQRVDIVELITEYLSLKQAGSVSFKALCPFHTEKTPSFHVSRDKQIWHCFGCGEGGDCFSFLIKIEGMDFSEALRHLGQKVGVEVPRFSSTETNEKQRLLAINTLAAKFYRVFLKESPSAVAARSYIEKRGITGERAEQFGLGFAPDAWDTLAQFLLKRGYSEMDGERAGLLQHRKQGSGMIDRFRGRIMIPLRDHHGNIVGFTARVFVAGDQGGPKYMNSPETAVYHKGSLLFGLDLAKKSAKEKGIIIVEGNLDVVASHKAGVENVVASSGTALTEAQLTLLKRYAATLIFSFDQDAAGFKAAHRGITLARQMGFDVRVAVLPPEAGKDPDEAVQKNPELWRSAVARTVPIMQYYIDTAVRGRDLANVDDKRVVSSFLLPEIARISDVVEREHWLQTVADLLRVDVAILRPSLKTTPSAVQASKPVFSSIHNRPKFFKEELALRLLIGLSIQNNEMRGEVISAIEQYIPDAGPLASLYKECAAEYHLDQSPASFFERNRTRLEAHPERVDLLPLLRALTLEAEAFTDAVPIAHVRGEVTQLIGLLHAARVRERRHALEVAIRDAERAGEKDRLHQLMHEYNELQESSAL